MNSLGRGVNVINWNKLRVKAAHSTSNLYHLRIILLLFQSIGKCLPFEHLNFWVGWEVDVCFLIYGDFFFI